MILPSLYEPANASAAWKAFNHQLLPKDEEVKKHSASKGVIHYQAVHELEKHGFLNVTELEDFEWIKNAALHFNPQLDLYPRKFAKMIDKFISEERRSYVQSTYASYCKSSSGSVLTNIGVKKGSHSITKLEKIYGEPHAKQSAQGLKGLVMAPCKLCRENGTKETSLLSCCQNLIHDVCLEGYKKSTCPYCKKEMTFSTQPLSLKKVIITKPKYDALVAKYTKSKPKQKKEVGEIVDALVQEGQSDALIQEILKRKMMPQKPTTRSDKKKSDRESA